jgi:hypothetical protein
MTEKYVMALKTYIEAWNNHDESALMSIFIGEGPIKTVLRMSL